MLPAHVALVALAAVVAVAATAAAAPTFRAAAVQMHPVYTVYKGGSPAATVNASVANLVAAVAAASADGAVVVVLPEGGPGYFEADVQNGTVASLAPYCEPVGDVGSRPNSASAPQQAAIAAAAAAGNVTVVLNMCEAGGHDLHYDTSVALGPHGTVLAVYRKWNLYSGDFLFNRTAVAVPTAFDTPFGRVGMFICYDLVHGDPPLQLVREMGVRHILFSTDWINDGDHTGAEFQRAFSQANGVNLIAANDALCPVTCGGGVYSAGNVLASYWSPNVTKSAHIVTADVPEEVPGPPAPVAGPFPPLGPLTLKTLVDCGHGPFSCALFNATAGLTGVARAVNTHGTLCEAAVAVGAAPADTPELWALEAFHHVQQVPRSPSVDNRTACRLRRCGPGASAQQPCPYYPSVPVIIGPSATVFTSVTLRGSGLGFAPNTSTVLPVYSTGHADVTGGFEANLTHTLADGGAAQLVGAATRPNATLYTCSLEAYLSPV